MAEPFEGELLPAVREIRRLRHVVCGYLQREAMGSFPHERPALALCGALVAIPLPREEAAEKCPGCLLHAQHHGLECDCFRLWPNGRIPSP